MIEYAAVDIYRELINEKNGVEAKDDAEVHKRKVMKDFI